MLGCWRVGVLAMYTERPLFGGALSCDIPTDWRDVSDIRQVPDHQEVWQEMDGSVLVVEILQRQDVDDPNAALFFFMDLAESNGITHPRDYTFQTATTTTTTTTNLLSTQIEGAIPCAGMGFQKIAIGRDYNIQGQPRENQEIRWTRIEMCAFRLSSVETDLLVTITKPLPNPNEPPADANNSISWTECFQRIVSSMKIQDWTLFV